MGFLDKNTRVIDMVLTDYGKELYSQGDLEFHYYAFSDDGVDYDPYIEGSGSLTDVQLREKIDDEIAATLVREAVYGLHKGENFESKDETNIKNMLFTIPQGQRIVPEMSVSPNVVTASLESKQQKLIEKSFARDVHGDTKNPIPGKDVGYRKFKAQRLMIEADINDYFEKSSMEGYSLRVFESGSSGLSEIKYKKDKKHITSFSNDLQLYKDEEIEKVSSQVKEDISKIVK